MLHRAIPCTGLFLFYRDRMEIGNDPHPTGTLGNFAAPESRELATDWPLVQQELVCVRNDVGWKQLVYWMDNDTRYFRVSSFFFYGKGKQSCRLTRFDFEVNGHSGARSRCRKTNSFANVSSRVLRLDVWHFQSAVVIASRRRQSHSTSAGPSHWSSSRSFITALEYHLTTWLLINRFWMAQIQEGKGEYVLTDHAFINNFYSSK